MRKRGKLRAVEKVWRVYYLRWGAGSSPWGGPEKKGYFYRGTPERVFRKEIPIPEYQ